MAVPAHDQRDWEFAKQLIFQSEVLEGGNVEEAARTEDLHVNSLGLLNGSNKEEVIAKSCPWLEEKRFGQEKVTHCLRDWKLF